MATILCIEDELDFRESVVEALQHAGYQTIEAADGEAGLEALLRNKPNLVLCDIRMPVKDGHTLLNEVRNNHRNLADIPFVFLSALGDRADIVEGKLLGADDYLIKPIDFDLLLATIQSRLRQIERMQAHRDEKLVKLYRGLGQTQRDDVGAEPEPEAPGQLGSTIARLAENNHGSVTVGRMQLVGLRAVKEQLGPRWRELAAKVRAVAESLIKRRLAREDVLTRRSDDEFVICFASLSEDEARFKAKAIERELTEHMLGSRPLKQLNGTLAVPVDPSLLTEVTSEARTLKIEPSEVEEVGDPIAVLVAKLETAAADARVRAAAIMKRLNQTCRFAPRPVCLRNRVRTRLKILDFGLPTRNEVNQFRRMAVGDPRMLAELDLVVLSKAIETIHETAHADSDLLAIPLSFDTIKSNNWSPHVFRACSAIGKAIRHRIAFKLSNVPISSYSGVFVEKLHILQTYCRWTILDMEQPFLGAMDYRGLRISLVSMSYTSYVDRVCNDAAKPRLFIKKLHESGVRLMIDQVPRGRAQDLAGSPEVDFMSIVPG